MTVAPLRCRDFCCRVGTVVIHDEDQHFSIELLGTYGCDRLAYDVALIAGGDYDGNASACGRS